MDELTKKFGLFPPALPTNLFSAPKDDPSSRPFPSKMERKLKRKRNIKKRIAAASKRKNRR